MLRNVASFLVLLAPTLHVHGLTVPFHAEEFRRDASTDALNFQNSNNETTLFDVYVANITVSGKQFQVQVDSGSSDLWLDASQDELSELTNTQVPVRLQYFDGTVASGPVLNGNVSLGGFTFPQSLISAPGSNATHPGDSGLMGVGPPALSQIKNTFAELPTSGGEDVLNNAMGNSLVENLFAFYPQALPISTFQLSRSQSTGLSAGGVFTIGELAPNMTNVMSQPRLPVISPDRWTVAMDAMVINGKKMTGGSSFTNSGLNTAEGQTLANLDTGTSTGVIPPSYANALYGNLPGAQFDQQSGIFLVPCDAKLNVSFVFAGVEIPVHPIDTVRAVTDGQGGVACVGGFQAENPDTSEPTGDNGDGIDFLLGDSFLRNVYVVFDYASLVGREGDPIIQLLSTTDADAAYAEFDTLSAARNATITGKSKSSSGTASSSSSSASASPTGKKNSALAASPLSRRVALIAGIAIAVVALAL